MITVKFALAMLAVAFTVSASATKVPSMNIVALDNSKALFSAVTDPGERTQISIQDEAGNIVYFKESKAAARISTVFDLSELKNGIYFFRIKTGKASAMREVEIQNGKVNVRELKTQLEPYFELDGDALKLSYLNFNGENMSLFIYKGSQLVYESGIGNPFVIQKGYDVSNLKRGVYNVVLAGGNEVYSYRIGR